MDGPDRKCQENAHLLKPSSVISVIPANALTFVIPAKAGIHLSGIHDGFPLSREWRKWEAFAGMTDNEKVARRGPMPFNWRNIGVNKAADIPNRGDSNGKGSAEKQPREEEAQAAESQTGDRRFAVFHPAAADHDGAHHGQE
jgi:hypothetical protein